MIIADTVFCPAATCLHLPLVDLRRTTTRHLRMMIVSRSSPPPYGPSVTPNSAFIDGFR